MIWGCKFGILPILVSNWVPIDRSLYYYRPMFQVTSLIVRGASNLWLFWKWRDEKIKKREKGKKIEKLKLLKKEKIIVTFLNRVILWMNKKYEVRFSLIRQYQRKKKVKVMFGNRFFFLTYFWEYKEKKFIYFWNPNHVWLAKIKKIVFWRKKIENTKIYCY